MAWPEGWHVCHEGEMLVASRYRLAEMSQASEVLPGETARSGADVAVAVVGLRDCRPARGTGVLHRSPGKPSQEHQSLAEPADGAAAIGKHADGGGNRAAMARFGEVAQWLRQYGEPQIIAGDLNMPPDSGINAQLLVRLLECLQQCGAGIWLHGVAAGTGVAVRHPHRPYFERRQLAAVSLLGRAGCRFRPPSADCRPGMVADGVREVEGRGRGKAWERETIDTAVF